MLSGFAISLRILSQPRTWAIAAPPRLNVDFIVNAALFVKTLQVRQQGRLRELHRLWCWPQRSSHGQDQLGYRPCTLTRGPAPKPTQPLFYVAVFFVLFLSPEMARRSSQKNKKSRIKNDSAFAISFRGVLAPLLGNTASIESDVRTHRTPKALRAKSGGTRCPSARGSNTNAAQRVGPAVAGRLCRLLLG